MLKTSTASKPIFLVSPRLSLSREATQHATSRQDRDKTSRSISQQAAKQTVASNTKTPPVYVRLRLGIITIKESYCIDHTKRSSVVQKDRRMTFNIQLVHTENQLRTILVIHFLKSKDFIILTGISLVFHFSGTEIDKTFNQLRKK